jgi:hypothetical protein
MPLRWRRPVLPAVVVAVGTAGVLFLTARGVSTVARAGLPPPPRPGFVVSDPVALQRIRDASIWSPVRHAVVARADPTWTAAAVARVSASTPEGTTNILELLGSARPGRAGLWQRVRLATLPNGTTGWVPRSALSGPVVLDTRLVINRARFRATLQRNGVPIFRAPVGVGAAGSPTPAGQFYVRDVVTRYRSPAYGPIAFGTSARSAILTDWPAGGYVGIHGTDQPRLIPGAISNGCIRMRNADILRLAALMPVGTPITIT